MESQKYVKKLKDLGMDELKAKSFVYDLMQDFKGTDAAVKQLDTKVDDKTAKRKKIIYGLMFICMIAWVIWLFIFNNPQPAAEAITNITQNVSSNMTIN